MLILLPPSEGKTAPADGPKLNLPQVAPGGEELLEARGEILTRLQEVSAREDALDVLGVGQRIQGEVEANTRLETAACAPAREIYTGVLYDAGDLAHAPSSEDVAVLVQSALFGVVDLESLIPAYRLSMSVKLPGVGALASWWRPQLEELLNGLAAQHQVVVDARSGEYRKAWPGVKADADLITVSAVRDRAGKRSVVSHEAKRYRGILTGALMRRGGQVENSVDFVIDTARSLIGEDVTGVEVRETKHALDLVIVTP